MARDNHGVASVSAGCGPGRPCLRSVLAPGVQSNSRGALSSFPLASRSTRCCGDTAPGGGAGTGPWTGITHD
eukprot:7131292-Prymnesium_polylepis.1